MRRGSADPDTNSDEPFRGRRDTRTSLDVESDEAVQFLKNLLLDGRYPNEWLRANIRAIENNEYDPLARLFFEEKFIGPTGHFALAAPFTVMREAAKDKKFSMLVGRVIYRPSSKDAVAVAERLQGCPFREAVNKLFAVKASVATGNLDGKQGGEAFCVPDSWEWSKGNEKLVMAALNNETEQRRRALIGFKRISRIFDTKTSRLLIQPLRTMKDFIRVQATEYALHDVGHHSGLGLNYKTEQNLLQTYWQQGVEECRADAMDFAIVTELFTEEEAKAIISSNFITRFGIDAHRSGGIDGDYDITVVLWLLDHLLKEGNIVINERKLGIRNIESTGLIDAVRGPIADGLGLTRAELALTRLSGLARLYNFRADRLTLEIFEEFILGPCRSLAADLR